MKTFWVMVLIVLMIFSGGCARGWGSKYFTYPPGTTAHEGNYLYIGTIHQETELGENATDRKTKTVWITIRGKDGTLRLSRKFQLTAASIDGKITWVDLRKLQIQLFESGNPYNSNEYNKWLIAQGPRKIFYIEFTYDEKSGQFVEELMQ